MISTIIFCFCLFLAIWFTVMTVIRTCYRQDLGFQLLILAAAWTGVITHLMYIW